MDVETENVGNVQMGVGREHHRVVIIGGGTAGITVAARLLRHDGDLDVAILEPSGTH
jgi:sulfide:quinone oxidoreductase